MKLQDILDKLLGVLKFAAKIPEWLLPKALKGWRTILINAVLAVVGIVHAIDIDALTAAIGNIFQLFGAEFNADPILGAWVAIGAFLNMLLRSITDGAVGENPESPE